jgi:hypothetical protein
VYFTNQTVYIFYVFCIDSFVMISSALDSVTGIQFNEMFHCLRWPSVASATTFIASAATQLPAYTSNINPRFLRCVSNSISSSVLAAGVGGGRSRSVASMSPSGLHFLLSTEAGSVWAECNSFIPQLAGVLMVNEGKDGLMHNHCPTEKGPTSCEYYLGKKSTKQKV